MHIVHVSTQRLWHGGEEQARLLIEGLRARNHECTVLAAAGGEFARRLARAGVAVHEIAGRSPRAIWRMRRALNRLRPDIVHFHDSHAVTGAGPAARLSGVGATVASRRVIFPLRSPWLYRLVCSRIIAVSSAVADRCDSCGIPVEILRIVHDGVDPAFAASGDRARGRAAIGAEVEGFVLLTVASLTSAKGHDALLQALPSLLQRRPDVLAVLAGDGPLRERLTQQVHRLGLAGRVRFLGYRQDIPDLLAAADLFVFPSREEGLGSSLIDAMLAGLPIVTTLAGGIGDLLSPAPDELAWTVPPGNADALAAALIDAVEDPQTRQRRSRAAAEHAATRFTADRMVENTLAVYVDALR